MKTKLEKTLKKSLGQNFLINDIIASSITNSILYNPDYILLEIGCGKGALTRFLYQKPSKEYHIVELDDKWAKFIFEEYGNKNKKITVWNQDILEYKILKNESYNIVANIPYNITYLILEKIFSWHTHIHQAVLMVQNEVALKLAKNGGSTYGPISVLTQLLFDINLGQKIGPEEFIPQPKVDSRIIILKKKEISFNIKDYSYFKKFLGHIFSHPRKKMKHQGLPIEIKNNMNKEILEIRAQEMTPIEILELFNINRHLIK